MHNVMLYIALVREVDLHQGSVCRHLQLYTHTRTHTHTRMLTRNWEWQQWAYSDPSLILLIYSLLPTDGSALPPTLSGHTQPPFTHTLGEIGAYETVNKIHTRQD